MNIFKQIKLGNALTKMANWWEAVEATRHMMPIGAGGGFDSLPLAQQRKAERELTQCLAVLRTYPRHLITEAVVKNQEVALRLGRQIRAEAYFNMFNFLVSQDVALNLDDFRASYQ